MSLALHDAAIGQLKRKVLWQAPQPVPVGACLSTYVRHVDHACWQMPGSGEQIASKKKGCPFRSGAAHVIFLNGGMRLCRMNSLYRANVGAGPTFGTYIRVNLVDVTLRYSLNRTFIYTGSASCAII